MAGQEFKDATSGGYFDREKESLKYDRWGEPLPVGEAQSEMHETEKFERPYTCRYSPQRN